MHEKFIMRRQEVLNERYLMRDADFLSLFEKIIELTTILALFLDEKTADEIRTSVLSCRSILLSTEPCSDEGSRARSILVAMVQKIGPEFESIFKAASDAKQLHTSLHIDDD